MIKEIKIKGENIKLPCRFSAHHGFTTLPLRYSDFCYRLQHGVISSKRQNQRNRIKKENENQDGNTDHSRRRDEIRGIKDSRDGF